MNIGEGAINDTVIPLRGLPVVVSVKVPFTANIPPEETDLGLIKRETITLSFDSGAAMALCATNIEARIKNPNNKNSELVVLNFLVIELFLSISLFT